LVPLLERVAVGAEQIHEADRRELVDEGHEIVSNQISLVVVFILGQNDPDVSHRVGRIGRYQVDIDPIIQHSRRFDSKADSASRSLVRSGVHAKVDYSIAIIKKDILVGLVDLRVPQLNIT